MTYPFPCHFSEEQFSILFKEKYLPTLEFKQFILEKAIMKYTIVGQAKKQQ